MARGWGVREDVNPPLLPGREVPFAHADVVTAVLPAFVDTNEGGANYGGQAVDALMGGGVYRRPLARIAGNGIQPKAIEIARGMRRIVPDQWQEPALRPAVEDQGVIVTRHLLPVPHGKRLWKIGHLLNARDADLQSLAGVNRQQ